MDGTSVQMDCILADGNEMFDKFAESEDLKIEPRPIFLKLGAVNSISGSAYMEYGNTKVLVVVEPPREITNQQRNIEIPCVVCCITTFMPSPTEDATLLCHKQDMLSISLKKVLVSAIHRNKFTNVQLDIKVTVLEDDGCALSTAINCCGAALVAAGIPIYSVITSSTICFYKEIEIVNPDANTEKLFSAINEKNKHSKDYGIVTTASFPTMQQVTGCFQRGMLSRPTFGRLLNHTLQINEKLNHALKHIFLENIHKTISANDSR